VNEWINKIVSLNDAWGQGATDTLSTPLGKLPAFSMRARHLRDASGGRKCAHFSIDFSSGYLSDGWQGVNFIHRGNAPVTDISGLPPWSLAVRDVYRNAILNAASLSNSNTQRLEGVVPYLDPTGVAYNKVLMFYVANAVNGPDPNLAIIRIPGHASPAGAVKGRQDGSGHGPIH